MAEEDIDQGIIVDNAVNNDIPKNPTPSGRKSVKRESLAVFFDVGDDPVFANMKNMDEFDPSESQAFENEDDIELPAALVAQVGTPKPNPARRYTVGPVATPEPSTRSPMSSKYSKREHKFIIAIAMILAFNSGFSNGVCLSGILVPQNVAWKAQSTSGFTGAYTKSALALADTESTYIPGFSQVEYFGYQVLMILSFMFGSCISALLNPRPAPWR